MVLYGGTDMVEDNSQEKIRYSSGGIDITETREESGIVVSLIKATRDFLKGLGGSGATAEDVKKVSEKVESLPSDKP
jgi:hypothetical protein